MRVVDARTGGDVVQAEGGGVALDRRCDESTVGTGERIECDLLVTAVGWTAPDVAAQHGRRPPAFYRRRPASCPAGGCPRACSPPAAWPVTARSTRWSSTAARRAGVAAAAAAPAARRRSRSSPCGRIRRCSGRSTHGMVDFSEDVSSKDLLAAAEEGYDSVELVKRFTTVTMGSAQGKLETVNAVAVLAEANGTTIDETGTTVWRPPVRPDHARRPGRSEFEPVRYSPMQPWHEAHGASPAGGRRLDPPRPLRRPGGRGPQRADERRHHRRHPAGQARPARPGRPEAAQPAVRQQVVQARRSAASATA